MLKRGPIPALVHGVIEYVAGVLLIVAPLVIEFDSIAGTALSLIFGVAVLALAAVTDMPTGLIPQVPVSAHLVLDFVLAVLLIASPFVFGFSESTAPTALFIVLGILHLLITIGTRFVSAPGQAPAAPDPAA
ncbi:MAG: SPW repeat protein [Geodermatophilaceae bacterium]|jgi:hypothetical protein|nr:SPW repeat protein [Geodermatophilaceae bacterium]